MLPLSCPWESKGGFVLAFPAPDLRVTPIRYMTNLDPIVVAKGPSTLTESISLEPSGPPNRILGTDGKKKWTTDAGKASKKYSPQHLSLYPLSLLSPKGGVYLPQVTFEAQSVAPETLGLPLGIQPLNYLFCLCCLFLAYPLDNLLCLCLRTPILLVYGEFYGQTRVLWAWGNTYHPKSSRTL